MAIFNGRSAWAQLSDHGADNRFCDFTASIRTMAILKNCAGWAYRCEVCKKTRYIEGYFSRRLFWPQGTARPNDQKNTNLVSIDSEFSPVSSTID